MLTTKTNIETSETKMQTKETFRNGAAIKESLLLINKALASDGLTKAVFSRDQWQELGGLTKYLDERELRFRNYLTMMVGGCGSPPGLGDLLQQEYAKGMPVESKKLFVAAAPKISDQIINAGRPLDDPEVKLFSKAANAALGELFVSALTPESIDLQGKIIDADIVKALGLAQAAGLLQDTKTLVETTRLRNEKERKRKADELAYKNRTQFMGIH